MLEQDRTKQHLNRKTDHIDICSNTDVEASDKKTGFEDFFLEPYALCGINQEDIQTQTTFLNQSFATPMMITGMTGGTEHGKSINLNLAKAAAAYNIPMGVGSQRLAIENPDYENIFTVKEQVPDVFLIANIGISQLLTASHPAVVLKHAVDMIAADAVAIHCNIMQELLQPEGDHDFSGVLDVLQQAVDTIESPIIVKEVGCGFDEASITKLLDIGVSAIDVGGRGGTSWPYIESVRADKKQRWGALFRDWGIPTAHSLATASRLQQKQPVDLVATGGIRSGVDIAKAVALGAQTCGIGLPFFKAALQSSEHVMKTIEDLHEELVIVMQACGCKTLQDLSSVIHYGSPYQKMLKDSFSNRNKITKERR